MRIPYNPQGQCIAEKANKAFKTPLLIYRIRSLLPTDHLSFNLFTLNYLNQKSKPRRILQNCWETFQIGCLGATINSPIWVKLIINRFLVTSSLEEDDILMFPQMRTMPSNSKFYYAFSEIGISYIKIIQTTVKIQTTHKTANPLSYLKQTTRENRSKRYTAKTSSTGNQDSEPSPHNEVETGRLGNDQFPNLSADMRKWVLLSLDFKI